MPNSIYDQCAAALGQAGRYGRRSVMFRGVSVECVVLLGNTSTKLAPGGLQQEAVVHILIPRPSLPHPEQGDPHTNEYLTFPATAGAGLTPRNLKIVEVIPTEWDVALTLEDPTK